MPELLGHYRPDNGSISDVSTPDHLDELIVNWLLEQGKCRMIDAQWLAYRIGESFLHSLSPKMVRPKKLSWEDIGEFADLHLRKLEKLMDKNFGLTPVSFDQMSAQLRAGDDTLFERIFLSHFEHCIGYLRKYCGAGEADAYDSTMDTLLEFHRRLIAQKISYGNLRFLFTRMAKQIYLKRKKQHIGSATVEGLELWEEETGPDPEELRLLEVAWAKLCEDCRDLLKQFYYGGVSLKEIAGADARKPAAVRKQKQRCVEKLRNLFLKHI